jgi:hypothetical protein
MDALRSSRNSDSTSRSSMSDQLMPTNITKKRLKQDIIENKENSNNDISSKYTTNLKRKAIINQSILIDKSMKINPKLNLSRNNSHGSGNRNKLINRSASSVDQHSSNSDSNPNVYDKVMSNNKIHNMDASKNRETIEKSDSANKLSEHIQQMSAITKQQQRDLEQENSEQDSFHNEKLATAVYKMLLQLEIKFPGKSSHQAKTFLTEVCF